MRTRCLPESGVSPMLLSMVNFEYLYRGLCGMAHAPRASSMAGHLGAAVIAGYFIGEDHPGTDSKVFAAIERDLDRITGGEESIWFDSKKAGITAEALFEPFPKEKGQAERVDSLADALARNIGKTRQSGHNVIFTSIAIRALMGHEEFATPALVTGIEKLIASFNGQHPGRGYFGKERGWLNGDKVLPEDLADALAYDSLESMAEQVIGTLITTASQHRRGFGGLFHLINHAAALLELDAHGYSGLALQGSAANRHHHRLYRSQHDLEDELGKLESTSDDPFKPIYWKRNESKQWGAWLTHRVKTLYGFHTLLRVIEDQTKRDNALTKFGYLLA